MVGCLQGDAWRPDASQHPDVEPTVGDNRAGGGDQGLKVLRLDQCGQSSEPWALKGERPGGKTLCS